MSFVGFSPLDTGRNPTPVLHGSRFLGHAKDSLWSLDLFRCESATLRTHWILVVMDQFTRRIVGFGIHHGVVDGVALCRMFNRTIQAENDRQEAPRREVAGAPRIEATLPHAGESVRDRVDHFCA